ncbi:hypothetical protein ARMGADRAFT_1089980 [Armillaria gallica]|uniref:C2H2-type domain-containing protein n=1 Tax=Armillaria gallica TaxID=47427 RepID=A0A2H3CIG3_ARMGA|nr:hypothetical protein ARMGADRAFT_1089980 [Armillaria gallica]
MTLVSEYDAEFEFLCFPDGDQGVDSSPLLLFSDKIDGSFLGGKAPYDDEISFSDACLTPPSLFDSEPYPRNDWSPAGSLLPDVFNSEDMSPVTVDPAVLTGPTPPSSLPPSSNSSPCTAQDPTLTPPSEGKCSPAPTSRHVRPRHSRQAKAVVKSYVEESNDDDEYEQKRETHSPKRSRRFLATPELVSDTVSASSTPLTLSTPISGTLSPRPTQSLPHRIVKKHVPAADDQSLDSDADDSEFEGESKKAQKPRGSGNLECTFDNCRARFQREPERKRHYKLKHSKNRNVGQLCEHCLKSFSRRDAVLRHYDTCEVLHPERRMAKRKGGIAGKRKSAEKATLK